MAKDVLLLCAHPEDHIIGAGGTLAKLSSKGENIHTIIFSYGELTKPHIKKSIVKKEKKKEAKKADNILGGKGIKFLEISEGKVKEELQNNPDIIKNLIKKYKPHKIFTHMPEDQHPDHKAISNAVLKILDESNANCEVYGFERWTFLKFSRRDYPRTVIDITGHMKTKVESLMELKSQKLILGLMKFTAYATAFINGLKNDMLFAEIFYRLR